MQIRATIKVSGDVQGVGYRDIVSKCEGPKKSVDSFIDKLKIKQFPVNVEDVKVEFSEPTGEFEYFEIKRGDISEELGERIDLLRLEMNKMVQKQDVMIGKPASS